MSVISDRKRTGLKVDRVESGRDRKYIGSKWDGGQGESGRSKGRKVDVSKELNKIFEDNFITLGTGSLCW